MTLAPDMVIAGRYRLDRMVGVGGTSHVWVATDASTFRAVALKFLLRPGHRDTDPRRRSLRDVRAAAAAIPHPHVVQVHDFFELPDTTPVVVMDLLDGETLRDRLSREGTLALDEAADILLPVISAVSAAHAVGIVHGDLGPRSVFLARGYGSVLDVRVLDFGIAKPRIA